MTPEQLEEIPGIGEKTLERISVAVRHYFGQYEEGETNPNASAEASPSETEEAKATEVDEPGTPDEPVEEITAELVPHDEAGHANDDAATETMEVENAADAERTHPVEAEDIVSAEHPVNAEAILQETEMAEEAAVDSGEGQGGV
jgi:N utilization substance protein A